MVQPVGSGRDRIDEQLRFLNVVGVAIVLSVAVLCAVAWWIGNSADEQTLAGPPLPQGFGIAGALVAVALLLAAPFVHRKMLASSAQVARDSERVVGVLETYRLATLLSFILREGAAIIGLMITLLTNEAMWCYVLSAAALVAMVWGWPRREELAGLLPSAATA